MSASEPLHIRALGLSGAGGSTLSAMQERFEGDDPLFSPSGLVGDPPEEGIIGAFANAGSEASFESRVIELVGHAWDDCFAHERPEAAVDAFVLLPESDPLTGVPKQRVVDLSVLLHGVLIARAERDGIVVRNWSFCNKAQASLGHVVRSLFGSGGSDCLIIGGDSYHDASRLAEAGGRGMLYSAEYPWGFIPGEAAGVLWLGHSNVPGPQVLGAGSAQEPAPERGERSAEYSGLTSAVNEASQFTPNAGVATWISDFNNSRFRAAELSFAASRASGAILQEQTEFVHAPMIFGECGTGYGFVAMMLALSNQSAAPTLITASTPLGQCSAILIGS